MRLKLAALFATAAFVLPAAAQQPITAVATFAGGCFWSMEHAFDHIEGVVSTTSGYAGGARANPTYENHEGHLEAVRVVYDPRRVSYRQLVDRYWRSIDPTDDRGQFCDRGPSYRAAVFYGNAAEQAQAEASRAAAQQSLGRPVVTPLRSAARFWTAEGYHQNYAANNPARYNLYRVGCRRDARLREVWGPA